jgi:hypothetical protein
VRGKWTLNNVIDDSDRQGILTGGRYRMLPHTAIALQLCLFIEAVRITYDGVEYIGINEVGKIQYVDS